MAPDRRPNAIARAYQFVLELVRKGTIPSGPLTVILAGIIGVLGGYGALIFSLVIDTISNLTVIRFVDHARENALWYVALALSPVIGLLIVSWITRRFAPEAEGHGVPEVIIAVARHDGLIRPRVAFVKILVSGICIGTGGSIGREGPIVQIGATLGSMAGRWFGLSPRHVKTLLAAGVAAGISATFNAPIAGVIFASEIILGSFAVECITPIVVAAVLADVVQQRAGEHGFNPAFQHITFEFGASWSQLPSYIILGLLCGCAAVGFTKLLYRIEDLGNQWLPSWWARAVVLGGLVGLAGVFYPMHPPTCAFSAKDQTVATTHDSANEDESGSASEEKIIPPLYGVGYPVVEYALHLENTGKSDDSETEPDADAQKDREIAARDQMLSQLLWLLPLAFLKPLATCLTLGGGGSGGIFAPSLYLGATAGASFGLLLNLTVPGMAAHPGVYAIVGMGAVVAGTTHGVLSAILIVYEMTDDYFIILPIMIAAGLSSLVARFIDPESIYQKKLSRRGESISRGHDMHRVEHIMVRDVMVREFPSVKHTDTVPEIVRVARANTHFESLPVMDSDGKLIGIIRPADLHRVLDSDVSPHLVNAEDIVLRSPIVVSPAENLLEALRDFGTFDVETLPVEAGTGEHKRLVGLLLRTDVMRRYREEMLRR